MQFTETEIPGVWLIDLDRHEDDRGWFARTWCREEFARRGLSTEFPQCNLSFNRRKGTLRGLHWQESPHAETKIVYCVAGAVFDVAVDMRSGSPSFGRVFTVELDSERGRAVYLPEGIAHGFQALRDGSTLWYQMGAVYTPGAARGCRWNDPSLAIDWPIASPIISARDQALPLLES